MCLSCRRIDYAAGESLFRRTGGDRQSLRARSAVGYSGSLDGPLLDGLTELNSLIVVVKEGVLPCPVPRIVDIGQVAIQAVYECVRSIVISFRVCVRCNEFID